MESSRGSVWGISRGSRTKHRGFSKLKLALENFKTFDSAKKIALLGICDYLREIWASEHFKELTTC